MVLYGHTCESAQETGFAYAEYTEKERKERKNDENVQAAFFHLNECMNTACELTWYHLYNERSKQSRALYLLMRMVYKKRPLMSSPVHPVKDILTEYTPSYPPSLN